MKCFKIKMIIIVRLSIHFWLEYYIFKIIPCCSLCVCWYFSALYISKFPLTLWMCCPLCLLYWLPNWGPLIHRWSVERRQVTDDDVRIAPTGIGNPIVAGSMLRKDASLLQKKQQTKEKMENQWREEQHDGLQASFPNHGFWLLVYLLVSLSFWIFWGGDSYQKWEAREMKSTSRREEPKYLSYYSKIYLYSFNIFPSISFGSCSRAVMWSSTGKDVE